MMTRVGVTVAAVLAGWVVLDAAAQAEEASAASVNIGIGIELFAPESSLWEESALTVAERLAMRPASTTERGQTWRLAAGAVLGSSAAEVQLLADQNDLPIAVTLNLINKGDYFTPPAAQRRLTEFYKDGTEAQRRLSPDAPSARRDLQRLFGKDLAACRETVERTLTALFGAGRGQSFQQAERQWLRRWDWQGSAFLLDARKDEFVILRILPAEQADEHGRSERRSDSAVKKDLADNVVREENGDVWIRDIPMVDQGEKGYCAVATGERILRYYGIAVDSHDLADAARTERGGGTTWSGMCEAVQRTAARNQRSLRVVGALSDTKSVSRYIDKGMPLIWGMFVTAQIEDAAHQRSADRDAATPQDWARRLRDERRDLRRVKPDPAGAHLRLIVGYNRRTGEIAYSDSWGEARLYWISEDEARLVSFPGTCLATVTP